MAEPIARSFNAAVEARKIGGVVVMAATDRGMLYEGAFGRRNIAAGPAMSTDTVFWIASMTKAVTAVAAMQLVEQGRLHLDQEMGAVLPQLAKPRVLDGFDAAGVPILRPARRAITLRHLLSETSGFINSIWSDPMLRYERVTGTPFVGECKLATFDSPILFDPGECWQYGINMDWVGRAIETISGQSLETYLCDHIFAPLGMADTGFIINPEQRARVATMYERDAAGALHPKPFEMSQEPEFFMGGGALFSTPRDYFRFLRMLLGEGRFDGTGILQPATVALMRQNQIGELNVRKLVTTQPELSHDVDFFPGMEQKWGLSFLINTAPGPAGRSANSFGWGGLFNTYFWVDPTQRVAGLIMTQILPFADPVVLGLYDQFERGVYQLLKNK